MKLLIVWWILIVRLVFYLRQLPFVKFSGRCVWAFNSLLLLKINQLLLYHSESIVVECFDFRLILRARSVGHYWGILDVFGDEISNFIIAKLLLHTWPVSIGCLRGAIIVSSWSHCAIVSLLYSAHILQIKVKSLGVTEKYVGRRLITRNTTTSSPPP